MDCDVPNCSIKEDESSSCGCTVFDDERVLKLAKRRLAAKRSLIIQIWDFILILAVCFLFIAFYDSVERLIVAFIFCSFWSIRLFIRILKFAKPSLKNGISAFFKERRERQLENEYNRLKKTGTEYEEISL